MFDYFRMWRLVRWLCKHGLLMRAMNRALGKPANQIDLWRLEPFLRERAEEHWFGLWKHLPGKYVDIRIEEDRTLLQRAHALNYVELSDQKEKGMVVHSLPEGDFFAKPTNGLNGFLKEYERAYKVIKWLCLTIISLLVWLSFAASNLFTSTLPAIKTWVKERYLLPTQTQQKEQVIQAAPQNP